MLDFLNYIFGCHRKATPLPLPMETPIGFWNW